MSNNVYYLYDNTTKLLTIIGDETLYIGKDNIYQDTLLSMAMSGKSFKEIKDTLNRSCNVSISNNKFKIIKTNTGYSFMIGKSEYFIPDKLIENFINLNEYPDIYINKYISAFSNFIKEYKPSDNNNKIILYNDGYLYKNSKEKGYYDSNSNIVSYDEFDFMYFDGEYDDIKFKSNYLKILCESIIREFWKNNSFPYDGDIDYISFTDNMIISNKFLSLIKKYIDFPKEAEDYIGICFYSPKKLYRFLCGIFSNIKYNKL